MSHLTATPFALALLLGVSAPLVACKKEQPGATVEKVKENPESYYGKEVVLSGEVDSVFGMRGFELESTDLFGDQVLVVARSDIQLGAQPIADDQKVRVTGVVRPLVITEIEREIGWDLQPEIEAEFRTRPVVVARSVSLMERPEMAWTETAGPAGTATAGAQPGGAAEPAGAPQAEQQGEGAPPVTDIAMIAAATDATELANRPARLETVTVEEVLGDRAFWVSGPQKERVLAVLDEEPKTPGTPTEGKVDVNKGQRVTLTGTLQPMPAAKEAQKRWNMKGAEKALRGKPLFMRVESVQVAERAPAAGRRPPGRQ